MLERKPGAIDLYIHPAIHIDHRRFLLKTGKPGKGIFHHPIGKMEQDLIITDLIGIFMFGEPIDSVQIAAFGIIWIGLAFFTYGEFKNAKEQ